MKSGEFQFIEHIRRNFSYPSQLIKGIGDDCAVFPKSDKESYLVTTDALVENIHFSQNTISYKSLGWKSIAVNLSDISAMGGNPEYIVISIAIPKNIQDEDINQFYEGIKEITSKYDVKLIGGDTTASKNDLFISITAIGTISSNKILYRNSAKPEDHLYITGYIGESSAGLYCLQNQVTIDKTIQQKLMDKHLHPIPRINEIQYLQAKYHINSAIDTSDGLSGDLTHILEESNVGAIIYWDKLPISNELKKLEEIVDIENYILHGGEDYELIISTPDDINIEKFYTEFKIPITRIGEVTKEKCLILNKDDNDTPFYPKSYDHFKI